MRELSVPIFRLDNGGGMEAPRIIPGSGYGLRILWLFIPSFIEKGLLNTRIV